MKRVKNKISIIFILIGCFLIITAVSMKFITESHKRNLISDYRAHHEQLVQEEISKKNQQSTKEVKTTTEKDKLHSAKTPAKKQTPKEKMKIEIGDTIGVLIIPKINLETVVCEGVDNTIIRYAVGHFPDTALPGQKGNFAVTGHRNYIFGQYFNRLDELENGDLVIVESETQDYTYEITDKFVVEPEELSVLDETEDETITLITCTPIRIATHRLIIKGKLVENK